LKNDPGNEGLKKGLRVYRRKCRRCNWH